MSETHIGHKPNRRPNYNLRRGVALGALALAGISGARIAHGEPIETAGLNRVTEPAIEAAKNLAEVVSDANDPKGRKVERHSVILKNVGGIKGATAVVEQGNYPKRHNPDEIKYVQYQFEAVGKNNVRGAVDEIVPDENPDDAVDAYSTYLRPEDQEDHVVHPKQEVIVAVDTGSETIIPADELTPDELARTSAAEG